MKPEFWIGRWERGETGWHQGEVEPGLVQYFPKGKPLTVLVPLCGKSLDLLWLSKQGHKVIGVELSELGVRSFFEENRIPFELSRLGPFQCFKSSAPKLHLTILQGDFFELTAQLVSEHIGSSAGAPIGAIYDRAALIALPPELRKRYSVHLLELVRSLRSPEMTHLQIVLERTPTDPNGPPFSVPEAEIRSLYSHFHDIELLSRETLETNSEGARVDECIYRLKPRA